MTIATNNEAFFDAMRRKESMFTETTTTPVPAPQPSLRKAAAEAMLAGALLLSDAQRDSANWQQTCMARASEERFRKALEQLAEELGK